MVNIFDKIIELIFSLALFMNAMLFIPQALRILRKKAAEEISLITFAGFLLMQLAAVFYGVIKHDLILIIGYALSMLTCGIVVVLAMVYNHRNKTNHQNKISLEEIIEQLPGHVYWKDRDGVMLGCNTNNWKDFGLNSLDEFRGKTDHDIFSQEEADKVRQVDVSVMQERKLRIAEELLTAGDGQQILYLSHKMPLLNKQREIVGILGTSVDITHARQTEIDRLETLENILAIMPGHVYWKDKDGVIAGCNDNQAKSAGFTLRKDIIGKTDYDLPWREQADQLRKVDLQVMSTGIPYVIEEASTLADGTEATFLSTKAPLCNHYGEITGIVGISLDITHRKQIATLTQEKAAAEQNAVAMSMLAGSIVHELRTPIMSVDMCVKFLRKQQAQLQTYVPKLPEVLDNASDSLKDMSYVVDMLLVKLKNLAEGKLDAAAFRPCSMVTTINEALHEYPLRAKQRALIHWNPNECDFTYAGELALTKHIFFNLIKNALRFIKEADKGEIFIRLESDAKENRVVFRDTAKGIEPNEMVGLFAAFATTDTSHHGAGLGLAFCKLVMHSYGGSVSCSSESGQWAEFVLHFPSGK